MKPSLLYEPDSANALAAESGESSAPSRQILERLMEVARRSVLEEMASGLAHELNQPLGAIATYAQAGERMLARPQPMIGEAIDVLKQISASALNAGDGIRRIRGLFNRDLPRRTRCSIPGLLTELLPLLQAMAERTHHRLELHIDPAVPDILADEIRIQHVLYALAQNAFEARNDSQQNATPVRIEVQHDQYSVVTAVSDSGPGVTAGAEPHLFQPFFTTKQRGTGLGLASSRAIVEAHDGRIGFENLPQGGAKFWVRLPIIVESTE